MSVERRWNRNEVSRESPDKEVNRRPTSLKKFRADAFKGPRVSTLYCDRLEYKIRRKGRVLAYKRISKHFDLNNSKNTSSDALQPIFQNIPKCVYLKNPALFFENEHLNFSVTI